MRIGLTFDLRADYLARGWTEEQAAEFDSEETIAALAEALVGLGHRVEAIGDARQLVARLAAGDRWDLVFNLAEGAAGRSREAQVPAILECFRLPYTFADPLTAALTLDKALAKRVVRDAGHPTPEFGLLESPADLKRLDLAFPVFLKPNAEGTGKGIDGSSLAAGPRALAAAARRLWRRFPGPLLAERFLPGREVTVGLVGTGAGARVLGVMDVSIKPGAEANAYSFRNKEQCETLVDYRLTAPGPFREAAAALALDCYRLLGGRDAGRVDLKADRNNRPFFLEFNPLAGLNPGHSDLPIINRLVGRRYEELLADILDSASRRLTQPLAAPC